MTAVSRWWPCAGMVVALALVGGEDVEGELVDEPQRPGDQRAEHGFGDAVGAVLAAVCAAGPACDVLGDR